MGKNKIYDKYKPNLKKEEIDSIERLINQIKILNPEIKENLRKYYISYRLGKCFVYIWLTKSNTWIYFRTSGGFKDSKNLCEPVPKGINDTFTKRIKFKEKNFDYILSLIRQSYSYIKNEI